MPGAADGRLVVFEGIDGSGKTTLIAHVAARLAEDGVDVLTTREPTDTWLGSAVQKGISGEMDPTAEALLFMADHAAHVARLKDELADGHVILSDRWNDSCLAYQGVTLADAWDTDPATAIAYLERVAEPFDLQPDLVLWVDVPPAVAVERMSDRSETIKFETERFLERVRTNYERLAASRGNYHRLDGDRSLQDVEVDAVAAIRELLGGEA